MCYRERYGTRFDFITRVGSNRKSHTQYSMVSLGILNLMLPIIVQIHSCLSPINRISTSQRNGNSPIDDKCEKKKKRREIDLGNEILLNFPQKSFTKNGERNLYIFLLDPSGLTGLEPAASALTGRCSDQLNYNPK